MAWIKTHATPRMNYYRSGQDEEQPDEALSLISQYNAVVSHLVPEDTEGPGSLVLWHPDLHLDNVFVDPDSRTITRIVDWQAAAVAPLWCQCGVPAIFRHHKPVREDWVIPERPEDSDTFSDEKKQTNADLESEMTHKYYEAQVHMRAPHYWETLQQTRFDLIRKPIRLVSGVWENRDLFFLRQSLISLEANWRRIRLDWSTTCPIRFSKRDLELHSKEERNMAAIRFSDQAQELHSQEEKNMAVLGQLLRMFRDQGVPPLDGMVDREDYHKAKKNSVRFKNTFVGFADSGEERELFSKLWPLHVDIGGLRKGKWMDRVSR